MGTGATSSEARWLLAAALWLGIVLILLGNLYLIAVFLGGRRWLSSKVGKIAAPTFSFVTVAPLYFLFFSLARPRIFAPQPSRGGYLVSGLLFSTFLLITLPAARGVSNLVTHLTTTPPNQPPAPLIKWARLCWAPALGLVLGLALGLLIGWLLGSLLPFLPHGPADASLPLFQRASVLFVLGMGSSMGLVFGLLNPFQKRLEWWANYFPPKHFTWLGVSLLVTGGVLIGMATWLIS
jgi:hypothetical protein